MERRLHGWRPRHLLPLVCAPVIDPGIDLPVSRRCICTWLTLATWVHRLDADHPDKDGLQLRRIAKVLKAFVKEAVWGGGDGCKVGVFLDYVSMPQRSRESHRRGKESAAAALAVAALAGADATAQAEASKAAFISEDDRTAEEVASFDRSLKVAAHLFDAHRPAHRPPPTPHCLPLARGSTCGTATRRRTCSSSTPTSPRARTRTCSPTHSDCPRGFDAELSGIAGIPDMVHPVDEALASPERAAALALRRDE